MMCAQPTEGEARQLAGPGRARGGSSLSRAGLWPGASGSATGHFRWFVVICPRVLREPARTPGGFYFLQDAASPCRAAPIP